ncbi:MAG TPA: tRNA (guanosine(37)-N1)-methyltransferase TrmD [Bdellovibrionota bacterium]|nr:tRNA (guanosine(37)-N1)-methyltransferase TrmD [Bdellovibrionota bacterium]
MIIKVLSLFPDSVSAILNSSILRRAQVQTPLRLEAEDLRNYADNKHRSADDIPYGGGQGMVFRPDVLANAMRAQLEIVGGDRSRLKILYATPRGIALSQTVFARSAEWLAGADTAPAFQATPTDERMLVIVCGRYEGVDERFIEEWVDLEFSLGDFILTGGEIPALAFADGVVRLLPGVLGNADSARHDSFSNGLLEHPYYTRPKDYAPGEVPAVLSSGDHAKISAWKESQSLLLTFAYRPDLITAHSGEGLGAAGVALLERLKARLCP